MVRFDVAKEKDVVSIDNLVRGKCWDKGGNIMSQMERMKRSRPWIDPWVVQKGCMGWDVVADIY